jgi:RNA polymerase sigma-B factor
MNRVQRAEASGQAIPAPKTEGPGHLLLVHDFNTGPVEPTALDDNQLTIEQKYLEELYDAWFQDIYAHPQKTIRAVLEEIDGKTMAEEEPRVLTLLQGYIAQVALDSTCESPLVAYNAAREAVLERAIKMSAKSYSSDAYVLESLIGVAIKAVSLQSLALKQEDDKVSIKETGIVSDPSHQENCEPIVQEEFRSSAKNNHTRLSRVQVSLLFRRLEEGDPQAEERLVNNFIGLADAEAQKYAYTGESMEDLVQVARLGLIYALHRFDRSRGFEFSTFAIPTISGEIKRYFRDKAWTIRVPRSLQDAQRKVRKAIEQIEDRGEQPTISALSKLTGIPEDELIEPLKVRASGAYRASSLDQPLNQHTDEGHTLGEAVGDTRNQDLYGGVEIEADIARAMKLLPERTQKIVLLRRQGKTQREIAEIIGCSQMQISRLLKRAVTVMSDALASS